MSDRLDEDGRGTPRHDVALVIPVLRDGEAARALLDDVAEWRPPPAEVVVACGEPDTALARLCEERGHRCLDTPANRGAQLDLGARATQAGVLWFVHADARAPADGVAAIGEALDGGAESGCFAFSFQGEPSAGKRLLELAIGLRVRAGGIAYGDQALFATREAYIACGGFAHQPLFEEVRLVRRLRQRGTFRPLAARVGVSPRRWERDGWVKRTLHNRWLALRYAAGTPAERLAGAYGPSTEARERAETANMRGRGMR